MKTKLFYFDKNGIEKNFEVENRFPSCLIKDKLMRLEELHIDNSMQLDSKFKDITKVIIDSNNDQAKLQALFIKTPKLVKDFNDKQHEIERMSNNYIIEQFKVISDLKQITTEEKEIFNQSTDSDFWQMQNLNNIIEAVEDFFTNCKAITRK